jgi:hypothetical protein
VIVLDSSGNPAVGGLPRYGTLDGTLGGWGDYQGRTGRLMLFDAWEGTAARPEAETASMYLSVLGGPQGGWRLVEVWLFGSSL